MDVTYLMYCIQMSRQRLFSFSIILCWCAVFSQRRSLCSIYTLLKGIASNIPCVEIVLNCIRILKRNSTRYGVCTLCIMFVLFGIVQKALCADTVESLEKKLKEKQASVKNFRLHLDQLTAEERRTSKELRESEKSIKTLEESIQKTKGILQSLENKIKQIGAQLTYLQRQQKRQQAYAAQLLSALWSMKVKKFALLEEGSILYKEERQYVWLTVILESIEQVYKKLEISKKEIEHTLEVQRNTYEEHKKQVIALEQQAKALLSVSLAYNKKLQAIRATKQSAEEELQSILQLIVAIQNQIEASKNIGKILPTSRGKLPPPVIGKVALRYNPSATPPYKGLGFSTKNNTRVTSIAEGTVVHNDILRGFGRVVIISHGKGFYTLYAFLSSSNVKLNSVVKQGEKIGETGFYPLLDGHGLYFEIRKETKNINPLVWLRKLE